jgi:hypothetical protein
MSRISKKMYELLSWWSVPLGQSLGLVARYRLPFQRGLAVIAMAVVYWMGSSGQTLAQSQDKGFSLFGSRNTEQKPFVPVDADFENVLASTLDWGDYDQDGDMDLVVAGRINPDKKSTRIYRNDGNGSFTRIGASLEGISEGGVKWVDYDGDGDLDVSIIGWDPEEYPTATLYENVGDDSFERMDTGWEGVNYGSIDWGDYDNDGDPDVLITGTTADLEPQTILYENQGDGTFNPVNAGFMGVWKGSAEWGDFDADGDLDLALTGRDREDYPIAVIYRNDGQGNFEQIEANLMGVYGGSSSDWGDFDDDGDLDLVITGWNSNIEPATVVYENKDNQNFEAMDLRLMGVNDGMARWVDFNNDDRLDLMVSGSNADNEAVTRLYANEPDTSFVLTNINLKGSWRSSFRWADIDGDGYPDLALTGADFYNQRMTIVYRNRLGKLIKSAGVQQTAK